MTDETLVDDQSTDPAADEPVAIDGSATEAPFFLADEDPAAVAAARRRRTAIQIALVVGYVAVCGWLVGPWFALFLVGVPAILIGGALWLSRRNAYRQGRTGGPMLIVLAGLVMVTSGGLLAAREGGPPTYQPPLDIPTAIAPRPKSTGPATGAAGETDGPSLQPNTSSASAPGASDDGGPLTQDDPTIWDDPLPAPPAPIPQPGPPAGQGGGPPPATTQAPAPVTTQAPPPVTETAVVPPATTETSQTEEPPLPPTTTETPTPTEEPAPENYEWFGFLG